MKKLLQKRLPLLLLLTALIVLAVGVGAAYAEDVTWNPNDKGSAVTLSAGNLGEACSTYSDANVRATKSVNSGKWYWEIKCLSSCNFTAMGVAQTSMPIGTYLYPDSNTTSGYYDYIATYHAGITENTVFGFKLDMDNQTLYIFRDNLLEKTITGVAGTVAPIIGDTDQTANSNTIANFGATPFTYQTPEGYQPYNGISGKTLDIESLDTAHVGDNIIADLVINNASNIYAEDIRITYDTTRLTYNGIEEVSGLKVYHSSEPSAGTLRFIIASQGEGNAANGTKTLLKIKFTPIAVGQAKIDVIKGRIADTTQEVDVAEDQCDEKIIEILGSSDVNRSGQFTLLDLAIDGWYYGKTAAQTDSSKYDADVVVDGNIDNLDLTDIVSKILQNTSYMPNA